MNLQSNNTDIKTIFNQLNYSNGLMPYFIDDRGECEIYLDGVLVLIENPKNQKKVVISANLGVVGDYGRSGNIYFYLLRLNLLLAELGDVSVSLSNNNECLVTAIYSTDEVARAEELRGILADFKTILVEVKKDIPMQRLS
jgi:hypothetical protein